MIGSLKIVDIPPPPRKAMLQNIGIENAWTLYALAKREWAKRKKWKPFPHKNLFRCAYKIPIQVFNCQTSGLTQPVNWTASTTENIHIYQFCLMIILSRFLNYKNGTHCMQRITKILMNDQWQFREALVCSKFFE